MLDRSTLIFVSFWWAGSMFCRLLSRYQITSSLNFRALFCAAVTCC